MATERTFGGNGQIVQCGKNTISGIGMIIGVEVEITEKKPSKPKPRMPPLPSGMKGKYAKKIRQWYKKETEAWSKQNRKWKKAQRDALKKAKDNAKSEAKRVAEEHMTNVMPAKQCFCQADTCPGGKKCSVVVQDKKQKANNGTVFSNHVTDTHAYASALSKWTANPQCMTEEEAEKIKKKKAAKKKTKKKKVAKKKQQEKVLFNLVDKPFRKLSAQEILEQPIIAIKGVGKVRAAALRETLDITRVGELAKFGSRTKWSSMALEIRELAELESISKKNGSDNNCC